MRLSFTFSFTFFSILFFLLVTQPAQAQGAGAKTQITNKNANSVGSKINGKILQKIDRQLQTELNSNPDIRYCYSKTDFGRKKNPAEFVIDLTTDQNGQVIERKLNSKLSTVKNPEITNCLVEVLSSLIIPFKSKERGKTLSTKFSFPQKEKKH